MPKSKRSEEEMGSATPEMAGDTTIGSPDHERIAVRAYELYLARGGVDGQAEEDWLTAEQELSNGGRPRGQS
jgi:hypothetical protein